MFKSLDFLYVPAPDIEASVKYYTQVLGAELLWKIHAYGVWVACVSLSKTEKPHILLADHIHKNDVMLIYQVENLDDAVKLLKAKGWKFLRVHATLSATLQVTPLSFMKIRSPSLCRSLRARSMPHYDGS